MPRDHSYNTTSLNRVLEEMIRDLGEEDESVSFGALSEIETVTRAAFITRLEQSKLLGDIDIDALLPPNADACSTRSLAAELVEKGHLTAWQAESLIDVNPLPCPLVLGEYTLLNVIGEGGMGVVFKARHRRLKNIAALKVLSPRTTPGNESNRRFQREIAAIGALAHPNIVSAVYADVSADCEYLVCIST